MMSVEDVYAKVKIDRLYHIATNGGVTFGGGEPLLYPRLISEFRKICDKDMTIFVETSLNVPWDNILEVADIVDCFHIDIKTMDERIYSDYTGGKLKRVTDNLNKLLTIKDVEQIVVRIPTIQGYTDETSQERSKILLQELGVRKFDLFDYTMPADGKRDQIT